MHTRSASLVAPGGDTDRIFPELIVREAPAGLAGLILASIFAVAMSNASGSLNSVASSSTLDWGAEERQTPAQQLKRSRLATVAWGVVLGALGLVRWGQVLEAGLTIASITYGGMLGAFLLGTWNGRANQTGALVGFTAGIASIVAVRLATHIAFTWYVLLGAIITLAVGSIASLPPNRALQATN
jgi:solute:Na+ symporter, SSS family